MTQKTLSVEDIRSNLDEVSATIELYKSIIKTRQDQEKTRELEVDDIVEDALKSTRDLFNHKLNSAYLRAIRKLKTLSDDEKEKYILKKLKSFKKKEWIPKSASWDDIRNILMSQSEERNRKMAEIIYTEKKDKDLLSDEELRNEINRIKSKLDEAKRNVDIYGDLFGEEEEIKELRNEIGERLSELDVRRYASTSLLRQKIKFLIKKRDLLRIQLDMAQNLVVDVERDDKVKRILWQVLKGIRQSQKSDQYYNIATDKPIAPGLPGLYYDTESKLAHTDQKELKIITRLLKSLLTKEKTVIPPQIKFKIETGKTGEHKYAIIPAELYNKYGEKPVKGDKKKIRVTAPQYLRFIQNYNSQFQPQKTITDEDIEAAFERLRLKEEPIKMLPVRRKSTKKIDIIVKDFPVPEVIDVPVESPFGKIPSKQVEVEVPFRYNVYVPAGSEKDQEYSSQRFKFLGSYYKNIDHNTYIRREAVDQMDENHLIQRNQEGYVIYGLDKNTGTYVRFPDSFSHIVFSVPDPTMWIPAISQELGIVLYAKNPYRSSEEKVIRNIELITRTTNIVRKMAQAQLERKQLLGDVSIKFADLMTEFENKFDGDVDPFKKFYRHLLLKGEKYLQDEKSIEFMTQQLKNLQENLTYPLCDDYTYVDSSGRGGCTDLSGFFYPYEQNLYVKVSGVNHYVPLLSDEFKKLVMGGRQQYDKVNDEFVVYNKYQVETETKQSLQFQPPLIAGFKGFTR